MTTPKKLVSGQYGEVIQDLKTAGILRVKLFSVQTGTGAEQTIAHGLASTPLAVNIFLSEATTSLAIPYQSSVPDATNIYITATNLKTYNIVIFY